MASLTQVQDEILQIASDMCSLLNIPFSHSSTINHLFSDKIYFDIVVALHPNIQEHCNQLQNKYNTPEKRLKMLINVMEKHLIEDDLSHIKVRKIIEKDIKMTLRLVEILYQYTKKKLNARRQGDSSELLLSDEEQQHLKRKIMNQEVNINDRKNKKKKVKAKKNDNKLSQSDLIVSKDIMKGLEKVKSQSSKKYLEFKLLNEQLWKKKKDLQLKQKEVRNCEQQQEIMKARSQELHRINSEKKMKSDNQKQVYLNKAMRQEEKSLELKLRDQKSLYLRRVSSALLKLERQKQIQEHKTRRDRMNQDNKQLKLKLQAIETYYKSQMELTKQCEQQDRKNRALVDRAYKQIASKLERQLRQESNNKIKSIKTKNQGQLLKMQDEEKIEDQVREIYKKYY